METFKVYVAGSSKDRERARRFMQRVDAHPKMAVAYDWVKDVDASHANGVQDSDLSDKQRAFFANADLEGVEECDALVLLAEHTPTGRGMWVELGYAIGLNEHTHPDEAITIIVSGGGRRSIFTAPGFGLVDFECAYSVGSHDDDAFEALLSLIDD